MKFQIKITFAVVAFGFFVGSVRFRPAGSTLSERTDAYFRAQLDSVKDKLQKLSAFARQRKKITLLRSQFNSCRLSYKKLAVLSEYFNLYETKLLNGPAISRTEEDVPDVIIPPKGFQAIEELLFSKVVKEFQPGLDTLINEMIMALARMENEPDRLHKFKPELVWDAIRSSSVRLTTLGITGYDSPVALQSLPEAVATIDGMKDVLALLAEDKKLNTDEPFKTLAFQLTNAQTYLRHHLDFARFDRLQFILGFMNPLSRQLNNARLEAGIGYPQGLSPVNYEASSLFAPGYFNINFFSPDKDYWITPQRIELGKKLFSDPLLSGTKSRSCASCHNPSRAFTDGQQLPYSIDNKTFLKRNTPTLLNSALQTSQFLDGRSDILEDQLKEVLHNDDEMKGSLNECVDDLRNDTLYHRLFREAYGSEKEPVNPFNIANAISSYVRSLIALNSRFDRYMLGDSSQLNEPEKNGFNLFAGKAKCATCHFIPLFNGLVPPEFTETETEVIGVPANRSKQKPQGDEDWGKAVVSRSVTDRRAFKTPTLRNIEFTAPYMHNGVFPTLEEVMEFYNEGGGAGRHLAVENQTLPKERLHLNKKEIAEIIAFMKTLGDTTAIIATAASQKGH
jgi:cytochrome c peroxidase